jgi:hypothetical protein
MIWEPDEIDWLALNSTECESALSDLFNSNPVINGSLSRPTLHAGGRALYNSAYRNAITELRRAFANPDAYPTSQPVHHVILDGITKLMIVLHYQFMLRSCRPKPSFCPISESQIWFPASYFVVRANWELLNTTNNAPLPDDAARRTTIFDWKRGKPQREFYDESIARHPVVVTCARTDGLYWIVPLTHSPGGVRVDTASRDKTQQYAKESFPVLVSWAMLHGDRRAFNSEGLRVRTSEFSIIRDKASRYWM